MSLLAEASYSSRAVRHQHTDTSRGAAHRHLERTLAPGQYTIPAHRPGAPRLRLLTFAVSVRGALGSEAQTFIRQLSARMAGAVPYRLLDEASWATQGCAPLLRSAITFSARRALVLCKHGRGLRADQGNETHAHHEHCRVAYFKLTYKVSRWSREPPVHSQTVPDSSPER